MQGKGARAGHSHNVKKSKIRPVVRRQYNITTKQNKTKQNSKITKYKKCSNGNKRGQRTTWRQQNTAAPTHAHTFSQNSLRNGLDIAEGSLAGASGDQSQRLVDAAKRGNIDGLRGGGENNGGTIMAGQ